LNVGLKGEGGGKASPESVLELAISAGGAGNVLNRVEEVAYSYSWGKEKVKSESKRKKKSHNQKQSHS